jgi:hypothetical protein
MAIMDYLQLIDVSLNAHSTHSNIKEKSPFLPPTLSPPPPFLSPKEK